MKRFNESVLMRRNWPSTMSLAADEALSIWTLYVAWSSSSADLMTSKWRVPPSTEIWIRSDTAIGLSCFVHVADLSALLTTHSKRTSAFSTTRWSTSGVSTVTSASEITTTRRLIDWLIAWGLTAKSNDQKQDLCNDTFQEMNEQQEKTCLIVSVSV